MSEEDQIDMMHDSHALWQEIERLNAEHAQRTAERDEARRWLCQILANPSLVTDLAIPGEGSAEDFADERGWDCFDAKEVK
jgi:hypothetical protein